MYLPQLVTILLGAVVFGLGATILTFVTQLPSILAILAATLATAFLTVALLRGEATTLLAFPTKVRGLVRLDNLSHPLLLRLQTEAPGTFFHSVQLANLASRAAKAIGADALLVRIGAYYQDIGKLQNPEAFIENIEGRDIIHEERDPRESAKLIIDHIRRGVELAQEFGFPKEVINLIREHHGTSLVSSFYLRAKKEYPRKTRRADFRYPGPKPQSREAAILMLADAIEAKTHNLKEASREAFEKLARETIKEKLDDGQLEGSGLSSLDLERLVHSFTETLVSMFHRRVPYPAAKSE